MTEDRIPDRVVAMLDAREERILELERLLMRVADGHPDATTYVLAALANKAAYCVYCKRRHLIADGCPAGIPFDPVGNGTPVFGRRPTPPE